MSKRADDPRYRRLSQRLKKLREELPDMSQAALARRLKVMTGWPGTGKWTQHRIAQIELGQRRVDVVEFIQLCHALGAHCDEEIQYIDTEKEPKEKQRVPAPRPPFRRKRGEAAATSPPLERQVSSRRAAQDTPAPTGSETTPDTSRSTPPGSSKSTTG